jgi:hypothetical protein
MRKLYIMCLEPINTRYTGEWYEKLPVLFKESFEKNKIKAEVIQIDGDHSKLTGTVTPGAFLNFKETNIWKCTQFVNLLEYNIKDGDVILYTDAWNTTILQLKYILSLKKINAKIMGIWHAGSYDPQDFLGRLIGEATWVRDTERAIYDSLDSNVFATEFHSTLFMDNLLHLPGKAKEDFKHYCCNDILVSGLPFSYLPKNLIDDVDDKSFINGVKKNQIVFPHRIAPEKQPEIFRDLANSMPDFDFVVCQDKKLTKKEYHKIMAESILCFSANLQETFGIGQIEASYLNTIPLCPDRLSYNEMYLDEFKYPSDWTKDYESYLKNKDKIIKKIHDLTKTYRKHPLKMLESLQRQQNKLDSFISAQNMIDCTASFLTN